MLVLRRKIGERLVIGDDAVVTIVELKPTWVGLGVDAPLTARLEEWLTAEDMQVVINRAKEGRR